MKFFRNLMLALFSLFFIAGAQAQSRQDFYLDNETGFDIYHVYVSPSGDDYWGNDVLGSEILSDGNSTRIYWLSNQAYRYYDVKVAFQDGESRYWRHIDLIQLNTLRLTYNEGNIRATEITSN